MSILRFSSKEEQILVEAVEDKAKQQALYEQLDWNSLPLNERTKRALTQLHEIEKK